MEEAEIRNDREVILFERLFLDEWEAELNKQEKILNDRKKIRY